MSKLDDNDGAVVFIGPDMESERLSSTRDTRYFEKLSEAVAWTLAEMPRSRRLGAYLETSSGERYTWDQLTQLDLSDNGKG